MCEDTRFIGSDECADLLKIVHLKSRDGYFHFLLLVRRVDIELFTFPPMSSLDLVYRPFGLLQQKGSRYAFLSNLLR